MLKHIDDIEPLVFNASPEPTIGVEMELWIVDPETRQLVPRAGELLDRFQGETVAKKELWQSMVEITTRVCQNVAEAKQDLAGTIARLERVSHEMGVKFISCGTHPLSNWRDQKQSEDERYGRLLNLHMWPAARLLISGLHVHVGVDSGEKAIAIVSSIPCYFPHLLALSSSSPFWHGTVTGLVSSRSKIFDGLPKAGLPPNLVNWAEFTRLMRTLLNSKTVDSIRDIWWDVRPHLGFGTVEVRICDALPTLSENIAIVALVQALIVHLSDMYDQGHPLPVLRNWTLIENKWRATRHGLEASIIRNEKGDQVPLVDHIRQTVELLRPTAERLGSDNHMDFVHEIIDRGNSTTRQLRVWEETQDFEQVVDALAREFETDQMG